MKSSALAGLNDTDPRVREAIVEAVEPLLRGSLFRGRGGVAAGRRSDARVRFRVALLLGDWDDHRGGEALARLARRDGRDSWMRAAILCSAMPHVPALLAGLLGGDHEPRRRRPRSSSRCSPSAGAAAGRRSNEAAARSIGRPAGQGGRLRPGSSPRSPACSRPANGPRRR